MPGECCQDFQRGKGDVLADGIIEDLEAAHEGFREIANDLGAKAIEEKTWEAVFEIEIPAEIKYLCLSASRSTFLKLASRHCCSLIGDALLMRGKGDQGNFMEVLEL